MGDSGNERIREILRPMEKKMKQVRLAKELGVSQGYLSDFMSKKRGSGAKILVGLANLRPDLAPKLLALRGRGGEPVRLPVAPKISEKTEQTARSILRKRGWEPEEIDAGKRRARLTDQTEADDPVAVADAWEEPLLGSRRRPKLAPR